MNEPSAEPARGFLFDPGRCTGCAACELACSTENELGWGRSWRQVVSFNPERRPGLPAFHLSLACNHCDAAPCVEQCPTLALGRDAHSGAVLIDAGRCMGCRYCSWVCPYDAPRFDAQRGVMAKCTLCHHRLVEGGTPACAEACPTGALDCGELAGEEGLPGFPATTARPRIRFATLRAGARPPESTWELPAEVVASFAAARPGPERGLTLRAEWPLWLFTSLAAGIVGWVLAAAAGGPGLRAVPCAALAAASLAVGTLHLGRKRRAWRAVANLRSRLSREVLAYGAFLGVTALALSGGGAPALVAAAVTGVLALVAIDRVYDPVRTPGGRPLHSADTVLTGPLVAAALLQSTALFALPAAVKLGLLARRWTGRPRPTDVLRLVAGLLLPPVLWRAWPDAWPGWALSLVALGELLDRAAFYGELRVPTPRDQARRDARAYASV